MKKEKQDNGKLKNQISSKGSMSLTYNYDTDGNMTKLLHNGIEYNYAYDNFGNPLSVKVGSQALVSYTYQADKTKLSSMTYGNGDTVSYGYDAYGNVTRVTTDLGKVSTMYDPNGKIIHQNDLPGGIKTTYHYDKKGNFTGETVTNTQPRSTYNFLYSNFFEYDADGRISKNILKSANAGISTTYNYDDEDNPSETVMGATRKVNYAYDEDGLLTGKMLTTNTAVNESFTYNDDELVSTHTLKHGTDSDIVYSYTYDDNGNITEIKLGDTVKQSYVYDVNNQLIRENNLDINKTITYTYDDGGNILSMQEYAYTTGDLGAVVDTVTYQYSDSAWTDKLTSYDGQSITYDEIGNPLSYRNANLTWYGRQLQTYTKDDTSISYKYDVNGLRTQKIVNGVKHEYYYVDGQLRYERNGDSYEIYYTYDLNGVPVLATKRDLVAKKNYQYYLVTNTRGDIIETRNGSGNVNARFTYDSWGKVVSVTDANGNELPKTSFAWQISLKYRGYVYDYETGLYYLQSRYYDPEVGRFINADDTAYIGATGTDLSYNLFAYCENEPVTGCDPSGYCYLNANGYIYHNNKCNSGKYNATKALDYAKKYWNRRNICYFSYKHDCTNFVSQCLYAGGLKMDNTWNSFYSYSSIKKSRWDYDQWSCRIRADKTMFKFVWYRASNAWHTTPYLYNYLVKIKKYPRKTFYSAITLKDYIRAGKIKEGYIAIFYNKDDGIHHAAIIGKVINKGYINAYYYAHSSDRNAITCANNNKNGLCHYLEAHKAKDGRIAIIGIQ